MHEAETVSCRVGVEEGERPHGSPRLEDDLVAFYIGCEDETLFEKWERGEARGDSTTPSVCSPEYRAWMLQQLRYFLVNKRRKLLSLGAGNAMVERMLCREGYHVLAVDLLTAAVELASRQGVPAIARDIRSWDPAPDTFDVIYADGVIGHLYDGLGGCHAVLRRMRGWLSSADGIVVVSNDSPPGDVHVEPAPGVNGFYWLSPQWMRDALVAAGYELVLSTEFVYERPLSGARTRAIIAAKPLA